MARTVPDDTKISAGLTAIIVPLAARVGTHWTIFNVALCALSALGTLQVRSKLPRFRTT